MKKVDTNEYSRDFRKDFPILKSIHYLDNAATTQKPDVVIDRIVQFYSKENANTHRGIYRLSEDATSRLEDARGTFARFINAEPQEIIFVKNATEGFNQLARSISRAFMIPGQSYNARSNIVTTEIEHHSNFVPWQQVCKLMGMDFRVARFDKAKHSIDDISRLVDNNTIAVSFSAMSNVSGLITDAKSIIKGIRKKNPNARIILDATQLAAHQRIDVKSLDVDFLCFSAHKVYGCAGVGIVYCKKKFLEVLEPFFYGGNMISEVSIQESKWAVAPEKFEAGTMDAAGIISSAEAVKYVEKNFKEIIESEKGLLSYLLSELRALSYVHIIGHHEGDDLGIGVDFGPVISFSVDGVHPHDLATISDRHDVCIRAGHHCCQPFMKALGVNATARASLSFYNSREDIDALIASIKDAYGIVNGSQQPQFQQHKASAAKRLGDKIKVPQLQR